MFLKHNIFLTSHSQNFLIFILITHSFRPDYSTPDFRIYQLEHPLGYHRGIMKAVCSIHMELFISPLQHSSLVATISVSNSRCYPKLSSTSNQSTNPFLTLSCSNWISLKSNPLLPFLLVLPIAGHNHFSLKQPYK